ncbi:MAG: hypothetical protein M3680_24980 [Myxococcota bacterium]|nr:hypothetical protein [Myxococcota bacterium]
MTSRLGALLTIAACGNAAAPAPDRATPVGAAMPWPTPAGWKSEIIPFPLAFAPALAHRGVEELRFAPGFFEPGSPGYWSYAFTWRTEDAALLDAGALAGELAIYFKGLVAAVDQANRITARDQITATATAQGKRLNLTVHTFDAFKTAQPIELIGWAERTSCASGALWVFVLAPATSPLRGELDELAATARCGQPVDNDQ